MALTGRMHDFGISEILQLIGLQKKTGALLVSDKTRKVEILFDQGNIVSAKHEPMKDDFDLGLMLAKAGLISRAQVAAFKKEQSETLKPLEQILLNAKALGLDDLKAMITLTRLETIYSLFLWKDGDYSFDQGAINYPKQWTDPISSEHVLMDGYRIKDEWPLIESVIPDTGAVLDPVAGEFGVEDRLLGDQRKVFDLVDGKRTAEDVVFLSRMGKFEALKVVKELVEAGRVRVVGSVAKQKRVDSRSIAVQAIGSLILAVGLLAMVAGGFRNYQRMLRPGLSSAGERAQENLWTWYQVDKVRTSLSMHAAMKGAYPEGLKLLVQDGELSGKSLVTGQGPLDYEVSEGGRSCRLAAPGLSAAKKAAPGPGGDAGG
ncbi:MAG TPA: DUF4388 domain-containing protein [bacterium]|nr:DUF4388 domain-containing protein [bacterium]